MKFHKRNRTIVKNWEFLTLINCLSRLTHDVRYNYEKVRHNRWVDFYLESGGWISLDVQINSIRKFFEWSRSGLNVPRTFSKCSLPVCPRSKRFLIILKLGHYSRTLWIREHSWIWIHVIIITWHKKNHVA